MQMAVTALLGSRQKVSKNTILLIVMAETLAQRYIKLANQHKPRRDAATKDLAELVLLKVDQFLGFQTTNQLHPVIF